MNNPIDYWYQKYLQEKKRADNLQSAIEVAEDHAYLAGQEAMREQMIDKACEWLKNNVEKYIYNATPYPDADFKACVGGKCWEYFRKAMKGE